MERSVFDYGVNFDYRAHLQFNSNTVAFFATKFVIGFHALQSGFFYGIKAGRFNSAFNQDLLANTENTYLATHHLKELTS